MLSTHIHSHPPARTHLLPLGVALRLEHDLVALFQLAQAHGQLELVVGIRRYRERLFFQPCDYRSAEVCVSALKPKET